MLAVLLLILMWTLSGCVNFAPPAAYIDGHTNIIIEDCERIARVITADSPAAPILRDMHWRIATRLKPWTEQLKRSQPAIHVSIPRNGQDHSALIRENELVETMRQEIDTSSGLPGMLGPFGQGEGGLGAGLIGGLLSGGSGLGIAGFLLKRFLDTKKQNTETAKKAEEHKQLAFRAMTVIDRVKETHKEAVIEAAKKDEVLAAGYKQMKAEMSAQEIANQRIAKQYLNPQS